MNTADALEASRAQAAETNQRAAALEAEARRHQQATAERAVQDAIHRGVIPPKATKLRDAWLTACLKDRSMIELLKMMPGSSALAAKTGRGRSVAPVEENAHTPPMPTPIAENNELPVYNFASNDK